MCERFPDNEMGIFYSTYTERIVSPILEKSETGKYIFMKSGISQICNDSTHMIIICIIYSRGDASSIEGM